MSPTTSHLSKHFLEIRVTIAKKKTSLIDKKKVETIKKELKP